MECLPSHHVHHVRFNARAAPPPVPRYGQTCLHLAARKASTRLLALLLSFSPVSALEIRDCAGARAEDVARSSGHLAAQEQFEIFRRKRGAQQA